ncbi:metal ABC transporter ATP-binding protein [Actinomadura rupiterrae]|uniref:metal ABC transporter ATP-binding protein n=1 Tax=Actinomadura rupiterrae TaxID=559627 RepID=UPI0020A58904|nr:metal ABC transporter ATP-binding protein [Actinomadura rupiterrae]MCP2338767.1 zinc transport system ATP-binding protein [Actinomadura rupiterrae]
MTDGRVRLDGREVLSGIDLRVESGDVLALTGPNGSGKSTLVRALLGLLPLSGGRTEIYGATPARFRDWARIGYVPQRLPMGGGVPATVREVVASGRTARQSRWRPASSADRAAVDRALEAVGLADRARDSAHLLSGGQQQRVLIARALAGEPEVIVMDEPNAGVDADNQRALARTLGMLTGEGRTVLLVLHELGPLEPLITRTVRLENGRIAAEARLRGADAASGPAGEPASGPASGPAAEETAGSLA